MIPFQTTADQRLLLARFTVAMQQAKLEPTFIDQASELARLDQGVFDLIQLWHDCPAKNEAERAEIVADIQESIDDYADAPRQPLEKPYIQFEQLDDVAKRVLAEKAKLRAIIEQHGGVSAVAAKAKIPQPSLSRLLNSPSITRRSTLYKIAKALKLPETAIAFEWTK